MSANELVVSTNTVQVTKRLSVENFNKGEAPKKNGADFETPEFYVKDTIEDEVLNIATSLDYLSVSPKAEILVYDFNVKKFLFKKALNVSVGDGLIYQKSITKSHKEDDQEKFDYLALFLPYFLMFGEIEDDNFIVLKIDKSKEQAEAINFLYMFILNNIIGEVTEEYRPFKIDTVRYFTDYTEVNSSHQRKQNMLFGTKPVVEIRIKSKAFIVEMLKLYGGDITGEFPKEAQFLTSKQRLYFMMSLLLILGKSEFITHDFISARRIYHFFRGFKGGYPSIKKQKARHEDDPDTYTISFKNLLNFMQELLKKDEFIPEDYKVNIDSILTAEMDELGDNQKIDSRIFINPQSTKELLEQVIPNSEKTYVVDIKDINDNSEELLGSKLNQKNFTLLPVINKTPSIGKEKCVVLKSDLKYDAKLVLLLNSFLV